MSKRILLTAGNSFVGHHILEDLLKNTDWDIVTIDRLSKSTSSGFDRMRDINAYDSNRVTHYTFDLNNPIGEGLQKELGQFNYILHVAANSHVDTSIEDPVPFVMNNVQSALTMLEYARLQPALEKFLYFSTDEVYGPAPEGVLYKEGDRYLPTNPYSASKAAAESICYSYANTYRVPIVITNGMNIVGERQHPEKYLPLVINKVLKDETVYIHSNPEKTQAGKRHYIHARNVASAVRFVLTNTDEKLDNNDASLGKFHIVGEKELDNLQLAQIIADAVGKPLKYEMVDFHSSRPGHDLRYAMSGDKLKAYGWEPPHTIEASIKNIVDWTLCEENKHWLDE